LQKAVKHVQQQEVTPMAQIRPILSALALCAGLAAALPAPALAHGDVVPQAVNIGTLPQLGAEWKQDNPYRNGAARKEALHIGSSAYNQNCARCHGLEVVSGGIAPDLRGLDADCTSLADAAKKQACNSEIDQYFSTTVRQGRTRDGRVYMPPFEGTLSQEAVWAIKTYIESRHTQ